MEIKNLSDYDFQIAIEALPSYNYDLAIELDGLTALSQVPENKLDEFCAFYKEYKNPEIKKEKFPLKQIFIYLIFGILIYLYFQMDLGFKYQEMIFFYTARVLFLLHFFSKLWLKIFQRNSNFFIRIFNNYFSAWALIYEYKGKTTRVEFWQSYLPHILVSNYLLFFAGYIFFNQEPHGIFITNQNLKLLSISYDLSYFFISIPLIIRRLRDIGKKNKILWLLLSFIPIYGLFIFSKPSFKPNKKV